MDNAPLEMFWAASHPQGQEGLGRVWNRAGEAQSLDRDPLWSILGGLGGAGKAQRLWLGQSLNPAGMGNGKCLCLMSVLLI